MAATLTTIDVSKWQDPNQLDWDGLKKKGLKSIIIQLSHGMSYEKNAKEFIAKARAEKIQVHGYHFYEGDSKEILFSMQNAQSLGLPSGAYMFLDMEGKIDGDWQNIFYSFRSTWLQAGWHAGLYCSDSPYKARFDNAKLVADGVYRWIASYSYEPTNYDIWQYSSSNGNLDVDYDRSGKLAEAYSQHSDNVPDPDPGTFYPGPRNPVDPTGNSWVGWGVDSSGLGGGTTIGYSTDGRNFYAALWPGGFVFRQNDADRMWDMIKDKFKNVGTNGPISSQIEWANILDKPELVTEEELADKLAGYTPVGNAVDWSNVTNKPDLSKFLTHDDLNGYATEAELEHIKTQKGDKGDPGQAATIHVGTVTEGDTPSVTNVGTDTNAVFDFVLPAGHSGGKTTGDQVTVDAIADVIKSHVSFSVDAKTGELSMQTTDINQDSLVNQVAASIASHLQFKIQDNDLTLTVGGES